MGFTGETLVVDPKTGFLTNSGRYALTGFTVERKLKFIEYLELDYNTSKAVKAIGITYETFTLHINRDPAFKAAVQRAIDSHLDDVESVLFQNAKREKGVADRIFLLKSRRKAIYGERIGLGIDRPELMDALVSRMTNVVDVEIVDDRKLQPGYVDKVNTQTSIEHALHSVGPLPSVQELELPVTDEGQSVDKPATKP